MCLSARNSSLFWLRVVFTFSFDPIHVLRFDSIRFGAEFRFGMVRFYLFMLNTHIHSALRRMSGIYEARKTNMTCSIYFGIILFPYSTHTRVYSQCTPTPSSSIPYFHSCSSSVPVLNWFISMSNTAHFPSPLLMLVSVWFLLFCDRTFSCSNRTNIITQSINI